VNFKHLPRNKFDAASIARRMDQVLVMAKQEGSQRASGPGTGGAYL